MAGRRCPATGCPRILTNGERYCTQHARDYETKRGTRQARGYDAAHDQLRAQWQDAINSERIVCCCTCGARLHGRAWDLGHSEDRRSYLGPQCLACNRSDGGRRGRMTET